MDINKCAEIVIGVETRRQSFMLTVHKLICLIPVERKEVQPYLDALEEKDKKCISTASEFFNGKDPYIKYRQNFDNWWEANRQLYKYLPVLFKELQQRYPDCITDEIVNEDYESVLMVGNAYQN